MKKVVAFEKFPVFNDEKVESPSEIILKFIEEKPVIPNLTSDSKNSDAKPTPSGGRPSGSFGGPR